jgi:CIC family chloride channel protein
MGPGTDQTIEAYHVHQGEIRPRVPGIKAIAATITLGSGGSGGAEGPIAQICAGIGSQLARAFKLGQRERRVLMMAGFAAGIGAVFHAPMAAAIFAAEVLYRDMDIEHEVLVPGIIAATVAYGVFGAVRGWEHPFVLPEVYFGHALQLIPYLCLAVVLAVGAVAFITLYRYVRL